MQRTFDVIVVGLGGMGALASYQLAKRGARVLGLDRYGVPNRYGSSGGASRMVRKIYHEHPDFIPLLHRAYELWNELEADSGVTLLHITGGLYVGEPDCDSISGAIEMASSCGIEHSVLDHSQIRDRYPQFELSPNYIGLFEPTAGWIEPERSIGAACHCAMLYGAELHAYEPMVNWSETSRGVTVRTALGEYSADQLIFCGGPWTSSLVDDLGIDLRVSRQVVGLLCPNSPRDFIADRFPVWSLRRRDGTRLYGFPMSPSAPGLKVANHDRSFTTEVDSINRNILPSDEPSFREGLANTLPTANGPLLSLEVCMYTNSPDLSFIVAKHPYRQRALIACGFSGHGFKFCSVIGLILADLAITGQTTLAIDFLSPNRFQKSTP